MFRCYLYRCTSQGGIVIILSTCVALWLYTQIIYASDEQRKYGAEVLDCRIARGNLRFQNNGLSVDPKALIDLADREEKASDWVRLMEGSAAANQYRVLHCIFSLLFAICYIVSANALWYGMSDTMRSVQTTPIQPGQNIFDATPNEAVQEAPRYQNVSGIGSGANRHEALLSAKIAAIRNARGEYISSVQSSRSATITFSDDEGDVNKAEQESQEDYEKRIEGRISEVEIILETQQDGLFQIGIKAKVRMN